MSNQQSPGKPERQQALSEKADKEYAATGAHAADDTIAELMDEGKTPVNEHHGEMRTDQSAGHRGGSQRQTQNRGRD